MYTHHWSQSVVSILLLMILVGCTQQTSSNSDLEPSPSGGMNPVSPDDQIPTENQVDSPDDPALSGCDLSLTGREVDLFPSFSSMQIHPTVSWDGTAFWMSWNSPNEARQFDVWAARISCELRVIIEPFVVSSADGLNQIDPSLAIQGDSVMITWQSDNSNPPNNLQTWFRIYDKESGMALSDVESAPFNLSDETLTRLSPSAPEDPERDADGQLLGNRWMPKVLPDPSRDGWLLIGSWGSQRANSFLVYLQLLTTDGQARGDAILVNVDGRDQVQPNAWIDPQGDVHILWKQGDDTEVGAWQVDSLPPSPITQDPLRQTGWNVTGLGFSPNRWSVGSNPRGQIVLSSPDAQDEAVSVINRSHSSGELYFHQQEQGDTPSQGMLIAYEHFRGQQVKVWWRSVQTQGSLVELGPITPLVTQDFAAPYPLAIATQPNGTYLVLTTQGQNPDFKLFASLLTP